MHSLRIFLSGWTRYLPFLMIQYHRIANGQYGHSAVEHVPLCLCSLLAAISQFRVSIGQNMQLTGYENANSMRNAKCAGTQTSME